MSQYTLTMEGLISKIAVPFIQHTIEHIFKNPVAPSIHIIICKEGRFFRECSRQLCYLIKLI